MTFEEWWDSMFKDGDLQQYDVHDLRECYLAAQAARDDEYIKAVGMDGLPVVNVAAAIQMGREACMRTARENQRQEDAKIAENWRLSDDFIREHYIRDGATEPHVPCEYQGGIDDACDAISNAIIRGGSDHIPDTTKKVGGSDDE